MNELRGSGAWWWRRRHGVATPFRLDPFDPGPFREGRGDVLFVVVVVQFVPHPTKEGGTSSTTTKTKSRKRSDSPSTR